MIKRLPNHFRQPSILNFQFSILNSQFPLMAACAAAKRAIGTRKGEQLT